MTTATTRGVENRERSPRAVQVLVAEWAGECPPSGAANPLGDDRVFIAQQPDESMEALVERVATRLTFLEREGLELVSAQLFSGRARGASARHWRALLARLLAKTVGPNGSLSLGGALLTTVDGLADTWTLVESLLPRVAGGVCVHVKFPGTVLSESSHAWSLAAA